MSSATSLIHKIRSQVNIWWDAMNVRQGKSFQWCTNFLYCSVLSLGSNVNTRVGVSQPDMGSTTAIDFPCLTFLKWLSWTLCYSQCYSPWKDYNFVNWLFLIMGSRCNYWFLAHFLCWKTYSNYTFHSTISSTLCIR